MNLLTAELYERVITIGGSCARASRRTLGEVVDVYHTYIVAIDGANISKVHLAIVEEDSLILAVINKFCFASIIAS